MLKCVFLNKNVRNKTKQCLKKIKMILTIYKMCYIIALKNRKNIKNKQIAQTFEQNRT